MVCDVNTPISFVNNDAKMPCINMSVSSVNNVAEKSASTHLSPQ